MSLRNRLIARPWPSSISISRIASTTAGILRTACISSLLMTFIDVLLGVCDQRGSVYRLLQQPVFERDVEHRLHEFGIERRSKRRPGHPGDQRRVEPKALQEDLSALVAVRLCPASGVIDRALQLDGIRRVRREPILLGIPRTDIEAVGDGI